MPTTDGKTYQLTAGDNSLNFTLYENGAWKNVWQSALKSDLNYTRQKFTPLIGKDTFDRCRYFKKPNMLIVSFNIYETSITAGATTELCDLSGVYKNDIRVSSVAISGNGKTIVCYSDNGKIMLFCPGTGINNESIFGQLVIPII